MSRALSAFLCLMLIGGCGLSSLDETDGECQEGFERDDEGRCSAASGSVDPESMEELDDGAPADSECSDSEECTLEMCPPESVSCVCLPGDNICVPGCESDDDCPSIDGEPLLCDDDGICGPEEI